MMNLLEAEDTVKGMPDAMLVQQMQKPSGQIPSYLIASELQRRKDMRQRYQSQQQQPAGTVAQQIVSQAMQPAQPPMSPPMQAPRVSPAQMGGIVGVAPNMQRMAQGGQVKRMQAGGILSPISGKSIEQLVREAIDRGASISDLLSIPGIAANPSAQAEIAKFISERQQKAQMNMPNYSMIAPSGLGFEDEKQAVADFISGAPQAMQDAAIAQGQRMDQATALRNQGNANMAQALGTSAREAMERFQIQNQMYAPNYNMIAPSGLGFDVNLPVNAGSNLSGVNMSGRDMNTQGAQLPANAGSNLAGVNQLSRDSNIQGGELPAGAGSNLGGVNQLSRDTNTQDPELDDLYDSVKGKGEAFIRGSDVAGGFGSDVLSAIRQGIRQTPFGQNSAEAQRNIQDVFANDGFAAAAGQAVREIPGGLASLVETAAGPYIGAADYLTRGPARFLDQLVTGSVEDPLTLGDIYGFFAGSDDQLTEVAPTGTAKPSPQTQGLTDATVQGKTAGGIDQLTNIVPTGVRRSAELPAPSPDLPAPPPAATEDGLDMSDIVAQQQRMAVANALMQLGSGIIGRDYGGGAARAAEAFAQGNQAAQDTLMKERVAKFRAAQDERKFEESKRQFDEQLAATKIRYENALTVSRNESDRSQLKAEMDLYQSLMRVAAEQMDVVAFNKARQAAEAAIARFSGEPVSQVPAIDTSGWAVKTRG